MVFHTCMSTTQTALIQVLWDANVHDKSKEKAVRMRQRLAWRQWPATKSRVHSLMITVSPSQSTTFQFCDPEKQETPRRAREQWLTIRRSRSLKCIPPFFNTSSFHFNENLTPAPWMTFWEGSTSEIIQGTVGHFYGFCSPEPLPFSLLQYQMMLTYRSGCSFEACVRTCLHAAATTAIRQPLTKKALGFSS